MRSQSPGPATDTPYDVIASLVLTAPGRAAANNAIAALRGLAVDQDLAAIAALCRLVAAEFGLDTSSPNLAHPQSMTALINAADVPPLVRLYAAGFLPRALLTDATFWGELAEAVLGDDDISPFQSLVARNAPMTSEVFRAYLIANFAMQLNMWRSAGAGPSAGENLAVLDGITTRARIVPGDAADATFEFGRDVILACRSLAALNFVIGHELGHHVVNAAQRGVTDGLTSEHLPASIADLREALPDLLAAAVSATGHSLKPDGPWRRRFPNGLSVLCTYEQHPGGTYTHFSLTDAGGPIDLGVATTLGFCLMTWMAVGNNQVAIAQSSRGMFHIGILGPPPSTDEVRARVARFSGNPEELSSSSQAWFASIQAAGRVGRNENDLRYILGVAEPRPRPYGADPEAAWRDTNLCIQINEGANLRSAAAPVLGELLRVAVRCGDPRAVARLIDAGAQPDNGVAGARLDALGVSSYVLAEGSRVTYFGPDVSALLGVLRALTAAGFSLDDVVTDDGQTLLTDAAGRNGELVQALLSLGARVDGPNAAGLTPLAVAAMRSNLAVVRLLLVQSSHVNVGDHEGLTPLHYAAQRGDSDVVAALLQAGAYPAARSNSGGTPLALADAPEVVPLLVAARADVDTRDHSGSTPLAAAAARASVGVVRELLAAGADPDAANDVGQVPMHFVALIPREAGALDMVNLLLDAGATLNVEADDGMTPLMVAAMNANADVVESLIVHGADVNARTVNGNTALILASDGRREWSRDFTHNDRMEQCIRLLAGAGADVNSRNESGQTALLLATAGFDAGPVQLLLQLGADPRIRADDGSTPLQIARGKQHEMMISDLIAAGADDGEDG